MSDQRMVPMELLSRVTEFILHFGNIDDGAQLREIIDGPGVEPVGHFVLANGYWKQLDKDAWPEGSPTSKPLYLAAPSAPVQAAPDEVCTWKPMDDEFMSGTYEGSCGAAWTFNDGGVVENNMNYCPRCGRKIAQPPKEIGE